jgi:hypothetical protein
MKRFVSMILMCFVVMTNSGERKFTFGEQNENEVVFVPGKSGRIEFLFTELYGAKKIK